MGRGYTIPKTIEGDKTVKGGNLCDVSEVCDVGNHKENFTQAANEDSEEHNDNGHAVNIAKNEVYIQIDIIPKSHLKMRLGHKFNALDSGIADLTPDFLAS